MYLPRERFIRSIIADAAYSMADSEDTEDNALNALSTRLDIGRSPPEDLNIVTKKGPKYVNMV